MRIPKLLDAFLGALAVIAGRTIRIFILYGPGVAGPLLISAGLWMVWPPLGVIGVGVFLLALDWEGW